MTVGLPKPRKRDAAKCGALKRHIFDLIAEYDV